MKELNFHSNYQRFVRKEKPFLNFFFCQIKLQLSKASTKLSPSGVGSDLTACYYL